MTKKFDSNSKDEIGKLAAFFNLTFEKIKELLLVIKQMSVSLTDTGENLTSNAYQTASSINEITASIQSMKEQVTTQSSEVNQLVDICRFIHINITGDANILKILYPDGKFSGNHRASISHYAQKAQAAWSPVYSLTIQSCVHALILSDGLSRGVG